MKEIDPNTYCDVLFMKKGIEELGWNISAHSGGFRLEPKSEVMVAFGFAQDAHFWFTALDQAWDWARGFQECRTLTELKRSSGRKKR